MDGFEEIMRQGPMAREGCFKMKVKLTDVSLHEDSIHRGPGQVYPAIRDGLKRAIVDAGAVLFEPLQEIQVDCPQDMMGFCKCCN